MRIPYNSLNEEGKQIANRYAKYIYSLFILHALLLFVLLLYANFAVPPNLLVIETGMIAISGGIGIGFTLINRKRNRILPEYQVLDHANHQVENQSSKPKEST